MRSVVILGSTGSIGESALAVAEAHPDRLAVVGLATRTQAAKVIDQAIKHRVRAVAVADADAAAEARRLAPAGLTVLAGEDGVAEMAAHPEADVVLAALVGMAGLKPVLAAMAAGHDVALATKEVLVAAGEVVMASRRRHGVNLLPVDSEHSAIFQCLQSSLFIPACVRPPEAADGTAAEHRVRRLTLTASGGPFSRRPEVDLDTVTVADALRHPRWQMGRKVTIDSATLMNKGLELMEACWLFNLPPAAVGVLVHPESIVHSLVEFVDRSVLAQCSQPDMRFPIHYALSWPERVATDLPPLDLAAIGSLHFEAPDPVRFPCLGLAAAAAAAGGTVPAVLNAANEQAVAAFLASRIPFTGIWRTVARVIDRHAAVAAPDLEAILAADAWARRTADEELARLS